MNKGLSQLVAMILILLIGISLTGAAYIWSQKTVSTIYPEKAQDMAYMRQRACLSIENVTSSQIIIKNCGAVPLDSFNVYLDGIKQTVTVPKLNPTEVNVINIPISETTDVQITANYAETPIVRFEGLVASFIYSCTGLVCTFTDGSTDSQGTIVSRSWNFGDGGTSTQTNPAHAYTLAGTYTATLTVTNNLGNQNSASSELTVASCDTCATNADCPGQYCAGASCCSGGIFGCGVCSCRCTQNGYWHTYTCDVVSGCKQCVDHSTTSACCEKPDHSSCPCPSKPCCPPCS